MDRKLVIKFLDKVIFYLKMLKRVASDLDNERLVNEIHLVHLEADTLRERLYNLQEDQS